MPEYAPGDVFQINEHHGRAAWVGAFVLAENIYDWGFQGFVAAPGDTHDDQRQYYIRLPWKHVDFIGHAAIQPGPSEAPL
jgi:hypothetical protein